jgi:hypothetical protein
VGNKEYREQVRQAVEKLHNCRATHLCTEPVKEVFQGKTLWDGEVEIYGLIGHPKAATAYAWMHLDGPADSLDRYVAVLGIPPVDSAQNAVKAAIVAEIKRVKAN